MNILAQSSNNTNQVTMSSLEIVDFVNAHRQEVTTTEKPFVELHHRSFMAKAPQVLGVEAAAKFIAAANYTNGTGGTVQRQIYIFPKREACLMAMSYSYELQAQVFDRMTAMEDALKKPVTTLPNFADPAEAAIAWANEYKAKQIAQEQLAITTPKAQALDTIANTANTYTIRECVKAIGGIREKDLIQLLIDRKWIYRDATKKLQPCAQYVINGVFLNRTSPVITNAYDGQERVFLHMRVTAFGLTRITGLVNKVRKAQQVAA